MNERQKRRVSPLAEVELEALEAGREWTRRRIERNLQKLADELRGDFPPLSQRRRIRCRPGRMRIKPCAGEVEIETFYGQDPMTRRWLNPMRPLWGLSSHQELSPCSRRNSVTRRR